MGKIIIEFKSVNALKAAILLLFLVFFTSNNFAQKPPIVKVAKAFILSSFNSNLQYSKLDTNYTELTNNQGDILAYVFPVLPKGYIVVSSNEGLSPVIAFSTESNFDFTPNADNVLLDMLTKDLSARISHLNQADINGNSQVVQENRQKWNSLLQQNYVTKTYDTQYGPLLTSVWGGVNCIDFYSQPIYVGNYFTPNHYSPGCVATSTSIVMHYFKWPLQGVGYHTDYDNSGSSRGSYYANFGATRYYWSRMLDKYYLVNSYDKHQRAMGELAYHCAVAFDMDFEYNGSTSNLNRTPSALNNYFRYSAHYESSSWYSFWPRIRENIRNGYPVTIAISKTNGEGHAMVCDGYGFDAGQSKFYHLQFGWWGQSNGWYNIQGSWNSEGYSIIDGATLDILPDPQIGDPIRYEEENKFDLPILTSNKLTWDNFEISESWNGSSFNVIANSFANDTFPKTVIKPGNYKYKTRARINGGFYSNSTSTTQEVLVGRKDSALVSLEFDGNDSYFINDNSFNDLDISKIYTIETWVKINQLNSNSNYDVILDRRTVFSLYLIDDIDADYAIRFVTRNSSDAIVSSLRSDNSSTNLHFGDWVHIAISCDSVNTSLFINGKEVDSSTDPNFTLTKSSKALNVGGRYWGSYGRYLVGEMDELRISNTARYLHTKEYKHYRIFPFEPDSATVLLMHYDEGSGSSLGDDSRHFFNNNLRLGTNRATYIVEKQSLPIGYYQNLTAEKYSESSVSLSWVTSFEVENKGFEVQRKNSDSDLWDSIAWVDGYGNSNDSVFYSLIDNNPSIGVNYYRLKQFEENGRTNYTNIDTVDFQLATKLVISPNPADNFIRVRGLFGHEIKNIRIYDISGHQVNILGINGDLLNVSNLDIGIYIIKIEFDNYTQTNKFIISR
jgi:hypothetical protein